MKPFGNNKAIQGGGSKRTFNIVSVFVWGGGSFHD